jgi:hypothetical protein
MPTVESEDGGVVDEDVHVGDGAVVSPTVDFLVLLSLTLVTASALVTLL